MADNWQAISGYVSNNYTDTMVFEVDGATKQLQKISGQTLIAGEKNSQYIRFIMPRYWDGIDVSDKNISIIHGLAGKYYGETAAVSAERTDDKLRFGWVVPAEACCIAGPLLFVLVVQDSNYILKTQITETPVLKSINLDDVVPEPTKEAWYRDFQLRVEQSISEAENTLTEAREILEEARRYVGAPMVANTAADMTDHARIYVYTGSETGYTSGHWYYWNGSSWEDGGVYNAVAVETDTSLSIQGRAADAKKTGDEISGLKEDLSDVSEGLDDETARAQAEEARIEALFTGDVTEAVNDWLDEHPEATTTVQNGSLTEEKFTDALRLKIDKLNAKVQLQRVFRIVCPKFETVGQCAVYTGHSFIFGSPANSNTQHRIVETDMNGNILPGRDKKWNNEDEDAVLGHMNDMYYYNGKIYVMGANRTIVVLDYETLEIESTVALNTSDILDGHSWVSLPTLDGVDGTLYTVGMFNGDGYTRRCWRIDLTDGSLTEVCSFTLPHVYNGISRVGQGLTIHDGRGYLAFNYDNALCEFDLSDGTIYNWMLFEDGDGSVPAGELETCVFIDGQMYIWGPLYYTFSEVHQRTQMICQLFKTNFGGFVSTDRLYGQGEQDQSVIRVNGTSTSNNPYGTKDSDAFNSIEEACMVYAYRVRSTHMGVSQLYVSNASGLEGQLFYLEGINFRANLGGTSLGAVELRQTSGFMMSFSADNLEIFASSVQISDATVTTVSNIIGSRVYLTGTYGSITKIEKSVVDFRGGSAITANNISIGTITHSKLVGGRGINLDGSITVGGTPFSYTLPNLINAKLRALPQSEAIIITIMLAGAGWNSAQTALMIRFPSGDMNNIKSGQTITRKGSFSVLIQDSTPYIAAGIVSATLNLTSLVLSLDTYIRTDTNEILTGNVYPYETTIAPINDQTIG